MNELWSRWTNYKYRREGLDLIVMIIVNLTCSDCALRRFVENVLTQDEDTEAVQWAGTLSTFLGFQDPTQSIPDFRSLKGFVEMLELIGSIDFLEGLREACGHCPVEACCLVRIILMQR